MTSVDDRLIQLVDTRGHTTGFGSKLDVHTSGVRHRAISCLLFAPDGRVLLQQRAGSKYHSPLLWSNACCTHPLPAESPLDAALRRLKEEMGIETRLHEVTTFSYCAEVGDGMIENEFVHVFTGVCDAVADPDPGEVEAWSWVHPEELTLLLETAPEQLTPWFRIYARSGLVERCAAHVLGGA